MLAHCQTSLVSHGPEKVWRSGKLHRLAIVIALLNLGPVACSSSADAVHHPSGVSTDVAGGRASNADGGPSASAGQDAGAVAGTFTHIYARAFKTCRLQCHGMGFSMLDMSTRAAAYHSLVDHASNPQNAQCAKLGLKRVEPGAPEQSLLLLKLSADAPCGQQMPPGGQLPQAYRDEVHDWIADGAKDN